MKVVILVLVLLTVFAHQEKTFVDKFLEKKPKAFSANVEFEIQGAEYVQGSFYSLEHNAAVTRYTVVGDTYLTMFDQYFNFTSGSLYVVQGGVCSYYSFPGLNLESEIETLF